MRNKALLSTYTTLYAAMSNRLGELRFDLHPNNSLEHIIKAKIEYDSINKAMQNVAQRLTYYLDRS